MRIIQPPRKVKANVAQTKTGGKLVNSISDSKSHSKSHLKKSNEKKSAVSDFFTTAEPDWELSSKSSSKSVTRSKLRRGAKKSKNTDSVSVNEPISQTKKEFNYLLAKGVHLLSMREHSTKEIEKKLLAKSDSRDIVLSVIDELTQLNYLSDQRFAESYVRYRANRGFGPIKIRSELSDKGIATDLIAEYLDMDAAIWFDNANDQYQKKYGNSSVSDYNTWSKRARFMQSRGFTSQQIRICLPQVDVD